MKNERRTSDRAPRPQRHHTHHGLDVFELLAARPLALVQGLGLGQRDLRRRR